MVLNHDLVALAVRIYEETLSGNKVAKRLDVSHSTAYRLLNAGNIELPGKHSGEVNERKRKLHGDAAEAVAADYAAGMRMADIKAKHGIGAWAIKTAAKNAGVVSRARGGRTKQFNEQYLSEASRLYRDGMSQAQIAARFNMGLATVNRALRAAGAEPRSGASRGSKHGMWKGGKVRAGKYQLVLVSPDDPLFCMASSIGYAMEHRIVMARAIGRPLLASETVHHIDGDPLNNKLNNLQLRFGRHGRGVVMACSKCGCREISYVKL